MLFCCSVDRRSSSLSSHDRLSCQHCWRFSSTSSSRHGASLPVWPNSSCRWHASTNPSSVVVYQSARRPPVRLSHCRAPVISCCWSEIWNSLPGDISSTPSLLVFSRKLKSTFLDIAPQCYVLPRSIFYLDHFKMQWNVIMIRVDICKPKISWVW